LKRFAVILVLMAISLSAPAQIVKSRYLYGATEGVFVYANTDHEHFHWVPWDSYDPILDYDTQTHWFDGDTFLDFFVLQDTLNGITSSYSNCTRIKGWPQSSFSGTKAFRKLKGSEDFTNLGVPWTTSVTWDTTTSLYLWTGGPVGSARKHKFTLHPSATKTAMLQFDVNNWDGINETVIPAIAGKTLDTNGNLILIEPDNKEVNVTPFVTNSDLYQFDVQLVSKVCAPVKITFEDQPGDDHKPWHFLAELSVVCRGNTNTPLATMRYWCDVDSNGVPTGGKSGDGQTNDIDKIVVDLFDGFTTNGVSGLGIKAHFIGCCDDTLNWMQTFIEDTHPPGTNTPPYNDHLSDGDPPYYYNFGDGPHGISNPQRTIDYP